MMTIASMILSASTLLLIAKPANAVDAPRMWAEPVYTGAGTLNTKWNFSIMVDDLLQVTTIACSVVSADGSKALIRAYYKGAIYSNATLDFSLFLYEDWIPSTGDIVGLTAGTTSGGQDITSPTEVFKIEVEALAPTAASGVIIDIYMQGAVNANSDELLGGGDCPGDHTVYVSPTVPHTAIVDSTSYTIVTESNSTVFPVFLDKDGKAIYFNITGATGTKGYINVTIPKALMYANPIDSWVVLLDATNATRTITQNDTHTFIYLLYNHSGHYVRIAGTWIVPEFPSTPLLLMLLTALATAFVLVRKVHKKPWQTL
jgi:hypothetical protein